MTDKMYKLRDILCEELDKIANKGELSAGELETAQKLTSTIKNIDKILMVEDSDGYSRDGEWHAMGSYNRGNSYAKRGMHYVRGHYSRDQANDYYSNNRMYSRTGEHDEIISQLHELANNANVTQSQRNAYKRAIDILDQA